jgi:hypothetical protein
MGVTDSDIFRSTATIGGRFTILLFSVLFQLFIGILGLAFVVIDSIFDKLGIFVSQNQEDCPFSRCSIATDMMRLVLSCPCRGPVSCLVLSGPVLPCLAFSRLVSSPVLWSSCHAFCHMRLLWDMQPCRSRNSLKILPSFTSLVEVWNTRSSISSSSS